LAIYRSQSVAAEQRKHVAAAVLKACQFCPFKARLISNCVRESMSVIRHGKNMTSLDRFGRSFSSAMTSAPVGGKNLITIKPGVRLDLNQCRSAGRRRGAAAVKAVIAWQIEMAMQAPEHHPSRKTRQPS